jgi:quercetin dioxygenase-like cupin family protein
MAVNVFSRRFAMKKIIFYAAFVLLLCAVSPRGMHSEEGFNTKVVLQKDISAYAGRDMLLSIGEVTIAPGASSLKHRHPGPTFVYVLEGSVESEIEGTPTRIYSDGESFYENPRQLHITTRNPSSSKAARILVYHLSRNGEPLTTLEQ